MSVTPDGILNGRTTGDESRERLAALLDRAPEIDYLLDTFGAMLKRGPDIADNVNRAIGDVRGKVGGDAGGVERLTRTVERLERLSESPSFAILVEKLQDPETAGSLDALLGRLERVNSMLEALERFLVHAPHFADNVNGLVQQLRGQDTGRASEAIKELGSIDPRKLVQLLNDLFVVVESPQTRALLGSSVFLDRSVALVDEAAQSAVEATSEAGSARGNITMFGVPAMMKDPDVQRTLQFAFAFARRFGQKLSQVPPA